MLDQIHTLCSIFLAYYVFLFKRNRLDFVVLFLLYTKALSWTLYKGECPISFYVKKYNDPSYKLGSNVYSDEIYNLFGKEYFFYIKFYFTIIHPIIETISAYLLFKRQEFDKEKVIFPLLFYVYYYISFSKSVRLNNGFTFVFLYILYDIVNKFKLFK